MKTFILSIIIMSVSGFAAASDRYIRIDTPGENDSVDPAKPMPVSGSGKGLYEGNVVVRIEGIDGKKLAQVVTTMRRDDIAAAGTWRTQITIPRSAPAEIRLIAFSPSPKEGDAAIASQPVLLKTTGHGLEKIDWQLHQYLGASGELTPVLPEATVGARFSNGKISGNAGCNRFTAAYQIKGKQLIIGRAMTTRKHCAEPDGIMEQEQQYLQALVRAHAYTLKPDGLELRDENGSLQVRYRVQKD
jgi:heat shock protein HslJ